MRFRGLCGQTAVCVYIALRSACICIALISAAASIADLFYSGTAAKFLCDFTGISLVSDVLFL